MKNSILSQRTLGLMFFALHLAISCLNDVLFKVLGQELPSIQVTFMRFFFATCSIYIFCLFKGLTLRTNYLYVHALRGTILFVGMSLWCFGLTHTPLADAIIINFTIPIFLLILCSIVLKERVEKKRWFATLFTFMGILIVTKPVSPEFNPYSLIMILTAGIFASCDVINKLYATKEPTECSLFYTAAFTSLCALIFMLIRSIAFNSPIIAPQNLEQTILTALLGIGANITLYLILQSLSLIALSETASIRYLEILLSALAGYIFFAEVPTFSTILGAALVIPTTIFVILSDNQNTDDKLKNKQKENLQAA